MPHKDPAARKAYLQKWAEQNREKCRAASARHYEKMKAVGGRTWERQHPEAIRDMKRDQARRLYSRNPESCRERVRDNQRRRRDGIGTITRSIWQQLTKAYLLCCAYCGQARPLTIDHIIPRSRGGKHELTNVVPACLSCNASKGDKLLHEWRGP